MHTEVRLENLKGKCGRHDRWWEDNVEVAAVNSRLSTWLSFLSFPSPGPHQSLMMEDHFL